MFLQVNKRKMRPSYFCPRISENCKTEVMQQKNSLQTFRSHQQEGDSRIRVSQFQRESNMLLKSQLNELERQVEQENICVNLDDIQQKKIFLKGLSQLKQKCKKTKQKWVKISSINYIFELLQSKQLKQNILVQLIPADILVAQFANYLYCFQTLDQQDKKVIDLIGQNQNYYYVLIAGMLQKMSFRDSISKYSRKSLNPSCMNEERRSKLKSKTTTQKTILKCSDEDLPFLVNTQASNICNLRAINQCQFLLVNKSGWNRFIQKISKLSSQYIIQYLKKCTTININLYSNKKQVQKVRRLKFLQSFKEPQNIQQSEVQQRKENGGQNKGKKTVAVIQQVPVYYIQKCKKNEVIKVGNKFVYVIIKGQIFYQNQHYQICLNESSIVNSSILLNLQECQISVTTKSEVVIAKIDLQQILFREEDQLQFILKLEQIQSFRKRLFSVNNKSGDIQQIRQLRSTIQAQSQTKQISPFAPVAIRSKDLKIKKYESHQLKRLLKSKRQRISHHNKQNNFSQQKQNRFDQLNSLATKYVNTCCFVQKIVESQSKIIQKNNLYRVNKLFPIQALLKNLSFQKKLQMPKQPINRKTECSDLQRSQRIQSQQNNLQTDKLQTSTSKNRQTTFIRKSKKTINGLANNKTQIKRVQQKKKMLQQLFQIQIQKNGQMQTKKVKTQRKSRDFNKHKINNLLQKMIRAREIEAFSERETLYSQKCNDFIFREGEVSKLQQRIINQNTESCISKGIEEGKYLKNVTFTQPQEPSEHIKTWQVSLQSFISGKNGKSYKPKMTEPNQQYKIDCLLHKKKQMSKKTIMKLMPGRIRQALAGSEL